jgi:CHASE2 domain-containing sensor protein
VKLISIIIIISCITTFISYYATTKYSAAEEYYYALKYPQAGKKNDQIIIVTYDDDTIQKKGSASIKRSEYAAVISKILEGKPKVLGVDLFFSNIKNFADDNKLIEVLKKSDIDIVLAIYPNERDRLLTNMMGGNYPKISVGDCTTYSKRTTHLVMRINILPFRDDHGREVLPFAIEILSKYLKSPYHQQRTGKDDLIVQMGDSKIYLEKNNKPVSNLINYAGGLDFFKRIPFEDIEKVNPYIFRDMIVLLGTSARSLKDDIKTPLSDRTPGIVIHANTIYSLLNNIIIEEVIMIRQYLLTLLACLLIAFITYFFRTIISLSSTITIMICCYIFTDIMLRHYYLYYRFIPIVLAVLLAHLSVLLVKQLNFPTSRNL